MKRRFAPRKTDADLTPKQIQRQIEKLQGEIEYNRGLRDNAQTEGARARYMRAIDARHEIIATLRRLPRYEPLLPMSLPAVHAAWRKDFPKLKA